MNEAVIRKLAELVSRKGIVLDEDNGRPHTFLVTSQKLLEFECYGLPDPAYLPDISPSDFHLFSSVQIYLRVITLNSNYAVNQHVSQFLANKDRSFYKQDLRRSLTIEEGYPTKGTLYHLFIFK